jgi:hypothetical protein
VNIWNWIRRLLRLRKKETPEAKALREYYSQKLLEHQLTTLQYYDLNYKAQIPKNPEVIEKIFQHFRNRAQEGTPAPAISRSLSDEELIEKTWGRKDPGGMFLKRLHEAAGSQEELLKFIAVIATVGGRLNRERGLDDSGKLIKGPQDEQT